MQDASPVMDLAKPPGAIGQAEAAAGSGCYLEAHGIYRGILAADPGNAEALLGAAQMLRRLRRFPEAESILDWARSYYPSDPLFRLERARLADAQGRHGETFDLLTALLNDGHKDAATWAGILRSVRLRAAAAALGEQETAECELWLQRALVAWPGQAKVLSECGLLCLLLRRPEQGIALLLQANARDLLIATIQDPSAVQADESSAPGLLHAALSLLPGDTRVLRAVAQSFIKLKQFDAAAVTLGRLLVIAPGDNSARKLRLDCLQQAGRFVDAQQGAEELLKLDPSNPDRRLQLANVLCQLQSFPQACDLLRSPAEAAALLNMSSDPVVLDGLLSIASLRWPEAPELLLAQARRDSAGRDLARAESHYRRFLEHFAISEAYRELLVLLRRMAVPPKARYQDAQQAYSKFPGDKWIAREAAGLAADNRDDDKAVTFFEVAYPDETDTQVVNLAATLSAEGKDEPARELVRAALRRMPHSPRLLVSQGDMHWEMLDYQQAEDAYRLALQGQLPLQNRVAQRAAGKPAKHNDTQSRYDPVKNACVQLIRLRLYCLRLDAETSTLIENGLARWGRADAALRLQQASFLGLRNQRTDEAEAARILDELMVDPAADHLAVVEEKARYLRRCASREEALDLVKKTLAALDGKESASSLLLLQAQWLTERSGPGDLDAAILSCREAARLGDARAYLMLAGLLARLNRAGEARELLERRLTVAQEQEKPDLHAQSAWLSIGENRLDDAQASMNAIPANRRYQRFFCEASRHFAGGEYAAAQGKFEQLCAISYDASSHTNLGLSLIMQVDEDPAHDARIGGAEEAVRRALSLDPTYAPALACLGLIAHKCSNYLDAETRYRASIKESAAEGGYAGLGALYAAMGRLDEAETYLKKACELDRTDAQPHLALGRLYLQRKQQANAMQQFREAVAIAPRDEATIAALALALLDDGQLAEAASELNRAIHSRDKSGCWRLHLALGRVYLEMGDKQQDPELYQDALREFQEVLRGSHSDGAAPYTAEARFCAGIASYKQQDWSRARLYFKDVVSEGEKHPLHQDAAQNLRRIDLLLGQAVRRTQESTLVGYSIAVFCLACLLIVGYRFFFAKDDHIPSSMVLTLTPLLLGVAVISASLPHLSELKLLGFAAKLGREEKQLAQGTTSTAALDRNPVMLSPRR